MTESSQNGAQEGGFRLRGWHVLAVLVSFFGVVFTVNGIFITSALSTFPGEEATRAYVRGLAYNEVIEARRAQAGLGWSAAVNLTGESVLVRVADEAGAPVSGLDLEGELRRPGEPERDQALAFIEVRDGVYEAEGDASDPGRWLVRVRAADEAIPFKLERDLWRR
ncbi:FixH family protein [Alkalicaulis satelles]|uniref:FixH family protein n=1 Tax=Alkalicaulis satelles TaxID=2609175 RepID=A0A5M6ZKL3_9PROT|nr:FixH family protein [Alkalicaulis satelles]KAA5805363.1 FixH family protein [Alkalicaulis satelles]